jgi:hypothetical protein
MTARVRMAGALAALCLAAPVAPGFAAGAPLVVAIPSKTEVSVGEPFTVELRASGPAGCTFAFPPALAQESIELQPAPADSGARAAGVQRYRAAVFALGDAQVPPLAVRYRLADGTAGEIRTAAVPLQVHSLLPRAKDEQKLADVRAPVRLVVGRLFWIALGLVAVLVAALIAWLVKRRRPAEREAPAPVATLAPDEEARRALEALAASGRLARGEYRPYYIALTAIAKRYLERRLEAPIVEMTTAEMLAHLRANPLGADMAPLLRDLSGAADRIKFARGQAVAEEAERHMAATRSLIEGLEARLQPSPNGDRAPAPAPHAAAAAGGGA